jgi:hypothetical protein
LKRVGAHQSTNPSKNSYQKLQCSEFLNEENSILPNDIIVDVMQYLDYSTRIRASRTCKQWYNVSHHHSFFKKHIPHFTVDDLANAKGLLTNYLINVYRLTSDTYVECIKPIPGNSYLLAITLKNTVGEKTIAKLSVGLMKEIAFIETNNCNEIVHTVGNSY